MSGLTVIAGGAADSGPSLEHGSSAHGAAPVTCCSVASRLTPDVLLGLATGLSDAKARKPGAESLNSLSRRLGIRKADLIHHRDVCLGMGGVADAPAPLNRSEVQGEPVGVPPEPPPSSPGTGPRATTQKAEELTGSYRSAQGNASELQAADGTVLQRVPTESVFQRRALIVADLMSKGRWNRRRMGEHAALWGISADAVQQYAKAASVALAADRGQLEQQREVSVAYSLARRDAVRAGVQAQARIAAEAKALADTADDDGVRIEALKTETYARKHYIDAAKVELGWQEHADKIAGVLVPSAPSVNVNVLSIANSPHFEGFMSVILGALGDWPEAKDAVVKAVRGEIEARRVGGAKRGM